MPASGVLGVHFGRPRRGFVVFGLVFLLFRWFFKLALLFAWFGILAIVGSCWMVSALFQVCLRRRESRFPSGFARTTNQLIWRLL
jgi:hypothetical protein